MKSSSRAAVGLSVVVLFVAALTLLAGPASACCTSIICPFCVSSSSNCVCGSQQPVCNIFGCNCNVQCGEWTPNNNGLCYFYPTCDTSAARNSAQARFDEVDANHDGKISQDEAAAWAAKQKDWDKNVKSKVKAAGKTQKDTVKAGFGLADKNHDGAVTPDEFDSGLAGAKSTPKKP